MQKGTLPPLQWQLPPDFEAHLFIKDNDTPPDSFIRQFDQIAEHSQFYNLVLMDCLASPSG